MNSGPIRRRSFLLAEVLVAMAIFALALVPLASSLLNLYRGELHLIERARLERAADNLFCQVKEKLYEDALFPEASFTDILEADLEQVVLPAVMGKKEATPPI